MLVEDDYSFSRFDKKLHSRGGFDCGVVELNNYIAKYAGQQQCNNLTTVYVCCLKEDNLPKTLLGYYTLSASSFSADEIPESMFKSIPRYLPIPTIKIGRLARDINRTRPGFGSIILWDALYRSLNIAHILGAVLVDVDAKNAKLLNFYKRHGFIQLQHDKYSLVLPIKSLRTALQESKQYEEII